MRGSVELLGRGAFDQAECGQRFLHGFKRAAQERPRLARVFALIAKRCFEHVQVLNEDDVNQAVGVRQRIDAIERLHERVSGVHLTNPRIARAHDNTLPFKQSAIRARTIRSKQRLVVTLTQLTAADKVAHAQLHASRGEPCAQGPVSTWPCANSSGLRYIRELGRYVWRRVTRPQGGRMGARDGTGCMLCEAGICLNPEHGVVRLFNLDRSRAAPALVAPPCAFCLAGICHEPTHYLGLSDQPLKIFDIRGTTFPPVVPLTKLLGPEPTQDRQDLVRPRREPKITIHGVSVAEFVLTRRCPTMDEEAEELSRVLGCEIGTRRTNSIPKIIHRFWTGGPMRAEAVAALADDGRRARAAKWRSCLWYSSVIEDELDEVLSESAKSLRKSQRQCLQIDGYEICDIHHGPTGLRAMVSLAVAAAAAVRGSKNYDDVKYFSDLARLQYLFEHGGIHIDIDMTLGDFELGRTYYHNDPEGQIPLMGTLARDNSDVGVVNRLRFLQNARKEARVARMQYEDAVSFLARRAAQGACMFNALIASRARTRNIALAINEYLLRRGLVTGMAFNRYLLLGGDLTNQQQQMQAIERAAALSVPSYVLRLNQLTPESDL